MDFLKMKHLTASLGLASALAASFAIEIAAQSTTVEEIANYRGEDRQQILEAGARKEGRILLYATGTQIQPLLSRFMEKYPFIRVEMFRAGSAEVSSRVLAEYQARHYEMDGLELATHGLISMREAGILQPFWSPEATAFDQDAIEPNRHWVVVRESYTGIGYNTNMVKPEEAPKSYEDLLDPKWKDKIAISGSISTAANWVGTLVILHGEDFVRKLGQQNIRVYKMTGRALANLMSAGEVGLVPTTYNSHVNASVKEGAPLAWHAPGPVPVTDAAVAIASRAPHPHAMMLLMDFLMSREGQEMYLQIGYDSPRQDIAGEGEKVKEKLYLSNRPNYIQEFEDWVRLYNQAIAN